MSKINILDQDTINKIAAGEVVERPASVVKELLENSIDAGATAVSVSILAGGTTQIRITDNGSGFEREDLPIAFCKNTTSKIRNASDLLSVTSLGFRGEALSSIAAVSKLELLTKTKEDFVGTRLVIEGGVQKELSEVGCPTGTTIVVNDLFYNTPVRRKFLKSAMTEAGYINDVCERIALSNPHIAVKFSNNGKLLLNTSGNGKLDEVIYEIYGREIASNLLCVKHDMQGFSLTGFVAKPWIARGNRNYETYFLNGRYIKSTLISKAIEEAYRGYLMQNKYPFVVLSLCLPNEFFDVNVHPAKLEVRFTRPELVYEFVYSTIRSTIVEQGTVRKTTLLETQEETKQVSSTPALEPFERKKEDFPYLNHNHTKDPILSEHKETYISNRNAFPLESTTLISPDLHIEEKHLLDEKTSTKPELFPSESNALFVSNHPSFNTPTLSFIEKEEKKKEYRIIGQIFSTYWLLEYENALYIIDQHAAHERILYEAFQKAREKQIPNTQQLLPPMILSLNLREYQTVLQYKEAFLKLGYEMEDFGGREIKITAIPLDLPSMDKKEFFLSMLDDLMECPVLTESEAIYDKLASMSCKAAVKGNQSLSFEEAKALIEQLMCLDNPFHCPHGRPVTIELDKREIEKRFLRIV